MLFIIGFVGHKQNFSLTDLEEEEQKLIEINQKTRIEQPSIIRQNLERIMSEKQIFLTQDLRINSLCKELNTNRTYLSQVLKEELNENFNSYINKHRVNYAISLLRNKELNHYSLEKFSELSGFGSTVSMIRAFKQTTGKAPSEFRN
jgi:YesN/AraC family two-component response regulator